MERSVGRRVTEPKLVASALDANRVHSMTMGRRPLIRYREAAASFDVASELPNVRSCCPS